MFSPAPFGFDPSRRSSDSLYRESLDPSHAFPFPLSSSASSSLSSLPTLPLLPFLTIGEEVPLVYDGALVDWKETPEAHVFKADLPGIKKEEVKVGLVDGWLQIRGERSLEHKEETDVWHRVERSTGKFFRRFPLPKKVKIDEIKANMQNGVLTVTVPKKEVKNLLYKFIEISD